MAEEKTPGLSAAFSPKKLWEFVGIILVTTIVWNLPIDFFGINGLTVVQQRIIAIFVFATLSWPKRGYTL